MEAPPPEVPAPAVGGRPRAALAVALLAAVLALFLAPALLGGGQFLYRDNGRMHAPVKRFVAQELRRGRLPEWNPYGGLGYPMAGGAVDAVQHPFNLLLLALPFEPAFKLWTLLSYLLAATGGFAWARAWGRSFEASLLAGMAFALSGPLVSMSDNLTYLGGAAALPWVLAAGRRAAEGGGAGRLALVGAASGLCAAAGDPQSWGISVALLPLQALACAPPGSRPAFLRRGLLASAAALAGAAPFVLPVLAWLPHSSRGGTLTAVDLARWNLSPLRLVELLVPNLLRGEPGAMSSEVFRAYAGNEYCASPWYTSIYPGITVLSLAALGAWRSRQAAWLAAAAGVFLWTALGPHAGFGQLAGHLPGLSALRYWEKMLVFPALLLALGAAFGTERLLRGGPEARPFAAALGAAAAAALALRALAALAPEALAHFLQRGGQPAAAEVLAGNLVDGLLESGLVCAVAALAAWALQRRPTRLGPALVLAIAALDLAAANVRAYQLSPAWLLRPPSALADHLKSEPGLSRVVTPFASLDLPLPGGTDLRPFEASWAWGGGTLAPAFNVAQGVGNVDPYTGMLPARLLRYRQHKGPTGLLPGVGLWGVGYASIPMDPRGAERANLRPPWKVVAVEPSLPAYLLAVPHRPRAYLAGELAGVDERGALEFALDDGSAGSGRSVVEGVVPADYRPPRGEARLVRDEPGRVALETRSDGRALLVLNDAAAPGWSATVDGFAAPILTVNYLARGVWVEAGSHAVSFAYRTPGLREGWAVFAAGALALAAAGRCRRGAEAA
jgi:hypothetical protein